jgi:hypothetical protein
VLINIAGGVLEFGAPEGIAYVPKWMMEKLLIESGGLLHVFNVTLPKGKMVVFQPHLHDFTKLSKYFPRSILHFLSIDFFYQFSFVFVFVFFFFFFFFAVLVLCWRIN